MVTTTVRIQYSALLLQPNVRNHLIYATCSDSEAVFGTARTELVEMLYEKVNGKGVIEVRNSQEITTVMKLNWLPRFAEHRQAGSRLYPGCSLNTFTLSVRRIRVPLRCIGEVVGSKKPWPRKKTPCTSQGGAVVLKGSLVAPSPHGPRT